MIKTIKQFAKHLWVNALPDDLFNANIGRDRCKALFRSYVDLVEIENHSFCNRTCWFCPNVFLDRRSKMDVSPEYVFKRIVRDLREVDYSKTLAWSRYHEPLGHASIFSRVNSAREALPRATLALVSNGDYLDKANLARLADSGVDRLMLDLYLPEGKEEDEQELEKSLDKFAVRTGLAPKRVAPREYVFPAFTAFRVTMGVPNYKVESISTRGGILQIPKTTTYHRTASCLSPIRHVVVDFNGKGMLCCQVRSDSPEHKSAIIGDLACEGYGLFDLYRDMASARLGLISPGRKSGVCQSCDVSAESNQEVYLSRSLHAVLTRAPYVSNLFASAVNRWSRFG